MARRPMTYADAVRILSEGESRTARLLGHTSLIALAAAGGFNFVEAGQEIIRLGSELTASLGDRLRGLNRMSRTERLLAAHSVLVITAYFDALDELLAQLDAGPLEITAVDQISLARRERLETGWRGLTRVLASGGVIEPVPTRAHESTLVVLEDYYTDIGRDVGRFVAGLARWDELDETRRDRFTEQLRRNLPRVAAAKFGERFRNLAVDCVEFRVWVDLLEHESTRAQVRHGLAALETLLGSVAADLVPDARRSAISRSYQAALERPITLGPEISGDLQIPTLGSGYIDHRFRHADIGPSSEPGRDSWWRGIQVRDDIHVFFAGYLTLPQALEAPLLVLGQPGSGKSVLTRVLAGRLPAGDFMPVRVELRQAPVEMELQDRIELAVREATGESLSWPRLVESCAGALPVVLLDGFDEMLQATGVSQTDFLARIAAFQEREADQGRPVAVIVTSRVAVADRAAIPAGATALRLEPFDDRQIAAWLDVWRRTNGAALREHDRRVLPLDVALQHRELAEQPLLLLMLALYDAQANEVQHRSTQLGRTELYERLLADFARREVRKDADLLDAEALGGAVERELLRMSVVAFAMFNRRSQHATERALNADLAALLGERAGHPGLHGFRTPLSAAQIVVGRFFFIHESAVASDGRRLRTYEFLHATFGEFLVARLVVQILADMANRDAAASHALPGGTDDSLLYAVLSFSCLTARAPIIAFLDDLITRLPKTQRAAIGDLALAMHRRSLYARNASAYTDYEPRQAPLTVRCAAWSANLVLLATIAKGEIRATDLFPDDVEDCAFRWRDEAMMWRSQLWSEEWSGLVGAMAIERVWEEGHRDVVLRLDDGSLVPRAPDVFWTYIVPPGTAQRSETAAWLGHTPPKILRKSNFMTGKSEDVMVHALEPIGGAFPGLANMLVPMPDGRWISATHALLAALVAPYQTTDESARACTDLVHVLRKIAETAPDAADRQVFMEVSVELVLTAAGQGAVDQSVVADLYREVRKHQAPADGGQWPRLLARLAEYCPADADADDIETSS